MSSSAVADAVRLRAQGLRDAIGQQRPVGQAGEGVAQRVVDGLPALLVELLSGPAKGRLRLSTLRRRD